MAETGKPSNKRLTRAPGATGSAARAGTHVARPASLAVDPAQLSALRTLFWHNVVREMLGGLMVVAEKRPELLDGRFAVLTQAGERIPIAQVTPVFGMSVRSDAAQRQASTAVQMTVFRVATPDGEVFTLPVHEIRGFHELTPELLARIQQAEDMEEQAAHGQGETHPFGFAAFQALPKLPGPAPQQPTE
jgi:hypothetical protein